MRFYLFVILLSLGAMAAAWFNPVFTLAISALVLAVFFLARNLEFGVLVLVFFFPYLGLVIDFGGFEVFREVPYLRDINAPFVDLFGLVLLVAWAINLVVRSFRIAPSEAKASHYIFRSLPHFKTYLLFWSSGLVSLLKVPAIHFATSLKYFARPFTFAYAVFFAVPVSILTSHTRHFERMREIPAAAHAGGKRSLALLGMTLLEKVLIVFYATGLLSAINGLLGLFFGTHEGFPRATPLGFFGVNPLGPNHNLLAETLIATAPAGLLLATRPRTGDAKVRERDQGVRGGSRIFSRSGIYYGMFFQWMVALLTFSRTAWIAVAVQTTIYIVWRSQKSEVRIQNYVKKLRWIVLPLLALLSLLALTMLSETVRGSTLSRLDQVRIAWFYFLREPLLGQGIGTFIPTLWQTRAFLLDYGEPLEAHGVLFKLMFEQGLLGLATFGIFAGGIVVGLYRTYRTNKTDRTYKTALIVALMIAVGSLTYQLFNTTYYTSKLWVPLALAVVISRIRRI